MAIQLKSKTELEKMRAAGRVVRTVLDRMTEMAKPGVTTAELDAEAGRQIEQAGAVGLFKNYPTYNPGEGFPCNLCISVNEVVVHGIAGEKTIEDGDIVGVDCGVMLDGWCGDSATTIEVGAVPAETAELCETTRQVLQLALDNVKPGRRWSQIARIMQKYAEGRGYGVVRNFVGHGIGQKMHEDPKVPNYISRDLLKNDVKLREGLVIAVEPMCNMGGSKEVVTLDDGWTVVTADRKPSAHYEHTLAVTADGVEVLTNGH